MLIPMIQIRFVMKEKTLTSKRLHFSGFTGSTTAVLPNYHESANWSNVIQRSIWLTVLKSCTSVEINQYIPMEYDGMSGER